MGAGPHLALYTACAIGRPVFGALTPSAHAHIQAYVRRIEELVGVPVRWIGVGTGRLDVIDRGEEYTLRIDSENRREFTN